MIITGQKKPARRKRRKTRDTIVEKWHLECHEPGSKLYRITLLLAKEDEFNDLDSVACLSDDGYLLSTDIGD